MREAIIHLSTTQESFKGKMLCEFGSSVPMAEISPHESSDSRSNNIIYQNSAAIHQSLSSYICTGKSSLDSCYNIMIMVAINNDPKA